MQNKVIYESVLGKDLHITIRYPNINDAKIMCDYINTLSKEKTFITYQGEEIKLKSEVEYLKSQLKRIDNHESVQLLLFVNEKLSGISSIDLKRRVEEHVGVLGISLIDIYRGKGLGTILMQTILEEAKKNLPKLRLVILEVMSINLRGIGLYKKFGFKEYANLPEGNKYKGQYVDVLSMYKKL